MVVGNEGEGKSTLVKTLLNWTVKSSRARKEGPGTILINLDPADGALTVPGTFSIAPIHVPLPSSTPVLPFGSTPTSGPPVPFPPTSAKPAQNSDGDAASSNEPKWSAPPNPAVFSPLVNALSFFYGHLSLGRNPGLAEAVIRRMGESLFRRLDEGAETALWRNGWIVDTSGEMVGKERRGLIKEAVRAFGSASSAGSRTSSTDERLAAVDVLLVLGNEKLHLEMTKLLSTNKTVKVVRVPKSGGASDVDVAYRRRLQASQVRSYFYGGPALSQGQLSPFTIVVKFDDLKIYRVGSGASRFSLEQPPPSSWHPQSRSCRAPHYRSERSGRSKTRRSCWSTQKIPGHYLTWSTRSWQYRSLHGVARSGPARWEVQRRRKTMTKRRRPRRKRSPEDRCSGSCTCKPLVTRIWSLLAVC